MFGGWLVAWAVALPPASFLQAASQKQEAGTFLTPGTAIQNDLAANGEHRYQVNLEAGQWAKLKVEQRDIAVTVELFGPDGGSLATFNDEVRPTGEQKIAFVADTTGTYTLLAKSRLKGMPSGSYSIRFTEVRAAKEDDRALFEVRTLQSQSESLNQAAKYEEALPLAERALDAMERIPGADQVHVALLMRELASLHWSLANPAKAQPLTERALAIFEEKLGPEHPQTARTESSLAILYRAAGEYDRAEQLLQHAIAVEEKTLGLEHPWLVDCLRSLGVLYSARGDWDRSQNAYERAQEIIEKTGGGDTLVYAQIQNNLGVVFNEKKEFARAVPYLERALSIEEKLYGQDHLMLTSMLNNLGIAAREQKNYSLAEQYYTRALRIREKALGPEHPELAGNLINIASLYHSEGDYSKSLEVNSRVLQILKKAGDTHDWTMILALGNIATTYAASGDLGNAVAFQARTEAAIEQNLSDNLAVGSEHQKVAYFNKIAERAERTVSLNLQIAPTDAAASKLAALTVLQRKGRVLDAMTDSLGALQRRSDPGDRALLEELKTATEQTARLSLDGPQKMSPDEYRERLKKLEEQKDDLEREISRHNLEFRAQSQPVSLESVQAAIPAKAALLEYFAYRPFDPKATTSDTTYGNARFAVYVIRNHGVPQGIDLGDAKAIHAAISRFREALRDPLNADVRDASRVLDEKIMQPVRGLMGETKKLLISPDGDLNLIPFEALMDEQGRFLLQGYSFGYLTTGRDLLRMQVARASKGHPLVLADPFFGEPETTQAASTSELPPRSNASTRRSITTGADLSSVYFAPLSGTSQEARAIQTLFPDAQVLTGTQATKNALQQMVAPRILHIATHGFFLEASDAGSKPAAGASAPQGRRGIRAGTKVENPLLRSGLALAGANMNKENSTAENGILTALEVSNLNLWGTKLVTLSACDTGVGEVKNGEGVYGLRRAFFLAGTESLVMSLWPVSDYVTRELMTQYYTGLKKGLGRGEALRQAQLAMLKRKGRQHPFYWASFIQAGEWANLDGQR
jgi:CHAT domain-containing protein/Tfp pilus assembly protein PilF